MTAAEFRQPDDPGITGSDHDAPKLFRITTPWWWRLHAAITAWWRA